MLAVAGTALSLVAEQLMPDEGRHAERAAGIARSRLNPEIFERSFAQDSTVRDAVQGDAAGEAEFLHAGFSVNVPRHSQQNFFGDDLNRSREVHFAFGQGRFRLARRSAEELVELPR